MSRGKKSKTWFNSRFLKSHNCPQSSEFWTINSEFCVRSNPLRFLQKNADSLNVNPSHQLRWLCHDQITRHQFPRIPSTRFKSKAWISFVGMRQDIIITTYEALISTEDMFFFKGWLGCWVEVWFLRQRGMEDTCFVPFCLKFGDWGLWGLASNNWWWPTFSESEFEAVWVTYLFLS